MKRSPPAALAMLLTLSLAGCGAPDATDEELQDIAGAEALFGLHFSAADRELMREDLADQRRGYETLRSLEIPNGQFPALEFSPWPEPRAAAVIVDWPMPSAPSGPIDPGVLAAMSVSELASLLRARRLTVRELTEFFLQRLRRFGPSLEAVITLTPERALAQADVLDAELARGEYRGRLHGIPYAAKDLIAVAGYPTTWGATPFRDQRFDTDAEVIGRLDAAGAVLLAKTSVGALAWGDVWFGGKTRNPWNTEEGSSGSSAGSAAAVAAGLVPFALGTETWGSIVSPATRVGVSGLRPTFGRVSRSGVMALSWSMDKVGVLCRHVEDCGFVFAAVAGADPADPDSRDAPFALRPRDDLRGLRIGVLERDFASLDYPGRELDLALLERLETLGAERVPIALPDLPADALTSILVVEAAAAFDALTRSGRDDLLVRQQREAWPNVLRAARLIPAVEYVQANRVRRRLVGEVMALFEGIDLYLAPAVAGDNLLVTNLTGHPAVVIPTGLVDADSPAAVTLIGPYFGEAELVRVAAVLQNESGFHRSLPSGYGSAPGAGQTGPPGR